MNKSEATLLGSGWPFILLVVVLIVFRKKIFAEATVDVEEHSKSSEPSIATPPKKEPAPEKQVTETTTKPAEPTAETSSAIIDLSKDENQCQASTTKGTRCKRTTTLDKKVKTIAGKKYRFLVCNQHNNQKFKPFEELLK